MKALTINEAIKFQRGQDPKDAMDIGDKWARLNARIKPFEDVQIGEDAYNCDDFEFEGKILAKGLWNDLKKKYNSTVDDDEMREYFTKRELNKLQVVAVSQNPKDSLEGYKNLIFLYNEDPSSVCCLREK